MTKKHNQWVTILGGVFKVLAEIFARLKDTLPIRNSMAFTGCHIGPLNKALGLHLLEGRREEAEGKIKKEKAEHPLLPKPAGNKYL